MIREHNNDNNESYHSYTSGSTLQDAPISVHTFYREAKITEKRDDDDDRKMHKLSDCNSHKIVNHMEASPVRHKKSLISQPSSEYQRSKLTRNDASVVTHVGSCRPMLTGRISQTEVLQLLDNTPEKLRERYSDADSASDYENSPEKYGQPQPDTTQTIRRFFKSMSDDVTGQQQKLSPSSLYIKKQYMASSHSKRHRPLLNENKITKFIYKSTPVKQTSASHAYAPSHMLTPVSMKSSVGSVLCDASPTSSGTATPLLISEFELSPDPKTDASNDGVGKTSEVPRIDDTMSSRKRNNSNGHGDITPKRQKVSSKSLKQHCLTPLYKSPAQFSVAATTRQLPRSTEKPANQQSSSNPLMQEIKLHKSLKQTKDKTGKEQSIIDAGQRSFGSTQCTTCGMMYTLKDSQDETQHMKFHGRFLRSINFPGWKKETVVQQFIDGRIIMVTGDDAKYAHKKVDEILKAVDTDLGFSSADSSNTVCLSNRKTFLYISEDKRVIGCLVSDRINKGYRVLANDDSDKRHSFERKQQAWCCSTESEPATCGVSRIWVLHSHRRQKIATRLMECLRCNFAFGCTLERDEIAFSDPTPDGRAFASRYCGSPAFLVYGAVHFADSTRSTSV